MVKKSSYIIPSVEIIMLESLALCEDTVRNGGIEPIGEEEWFV